VIIAQMKKVAYGVKKDITWMKVDIAENVVIIACIVAQKIIAGNAMMDIGLMI
jgi:hypothetical protein